MFGNEIVPNKGVKYSKLLEQFMSPFAHEFIDYEYIEDIFEFAINAWNFGNIRVLMPQEEFEKSIGLIQEKDVNIALLQKMINHKTSKFKEYTKFMSDFEIKEVDNGDPILSVVTQDEETYLADMLSEMEEEGNLQHFQEDFEENYINRQAIIIKPQQPFIDWYAHLNPEESFNEEIHKANIYLIDEGIDDVEKWLKNKFDKFFMLELDEWHGNKREWPQKRNYKMFKLWFRVEISEMIYDLEKRPILKSG